MKKIVLESIYESTMVKFKITANLYTSLNNYDLMIDLITLKFKQQYDNILALSFLR